MPSDAASRTSPLQIESASPAASPRRAAALGAGLINALLLTTYVLIGGLTHVAAKDALSEMPAIATGVVRFGIAALLLLLTRLVWRETGHAASRPIERADYFRLVLAGLVSVPVNQPCFLLGVQMANASHGGLFYAINPVLVYLLTVALGWTRWSLRMIAAAALAFVGAGVIVMDGQKMGGTTAFLIGDLLLLGAVSSWALYSILIVPLASKYGPIRTLTLCMCIGACAYAPAILYDGGQLDFTALSPRALGGFLFIAVMTGYVNYIVYFIAITRMEVNRISICANIGPLVAVVAAHFWLGEPISGWLSTSMLLLLIAITLANWDRIKLLLRPDPAQRASAA